MSFIFGGNTYDVAIQGKGYTYTWPEALGTQPWKNGRADKVLCQEYEPVVRRGWRALERAVLAEDRSCVGAENRHGSALRC